MWNALAKRAATELERDGRPHYWCESCPLVLLVQIHEMKGSKCRSNVQIAFGIGNRVGKSVFRLGFICLFFYDAQSLFV